MKPRRVHILLAVLILTLGAVVFRHKLPAPVVSTIQLARGKKSVTDRVEQYGPLVRSRLVPDFARLNMSYPPAAMTLVALKEEKILEVWISEDLKGYKLLKSYPILGASGSLGPKLREGDGQVPEGLYRIESLNPNSLYHLALRVDYPNRYDLTKARLENRPDPGSDIMIHGKTCSVGCLAMGDQAAEDLFVLAAECGIANISLILSPVDFRVRDLPRLATKTPSWTSELYSSIETELEKLQ